MISFAAMIEGKKDQSKFEWIYETYKNDMYYAANSILQNSYDAEDAVEISMIKLIHIFNNITDNEIYTVKFRNLMLTIAKNTAIDMLRKRNRMAVPTEEPYEGPAGASPSAEDLYIEAEDYQTLLRCINELDDKYKDVLRLRSLYHLPAKAVAEILNVKEISISSRLSRARKKLAEKLKEYKQK